MDFVDDFEQDSGMESSPLNDDSSSKDDTPERKPDDLAKDKGESADKTETPRAIAGGEEILKDNETTDDTVARLYPPGENYDDEPDESLGERLWGLTEMFPDVVSNTTHFVLSKSWSGAKSLYSFSRTASWIVASSCVILFAPVVFELERAKMDEMQKSQQKQFLLGPSAAMVGSGAPAPPLPR